MHGNKPYRVVSVFDDAIDGHAMGGIGRGLEAIVDYATKRPEEIPPARAGMSLMVLTLRRLSEDEMEFCESAPTEQRRNVRAFSFGVTQIENAKTVDGKCHPVLSPTGERTFGNQAVKVWDDAQLALISRAVKVEIGGVAYSRSFLAHQSAPPCQLPHSLGDAFKAVLAQHAGVIRDAAAARSNEQPPSSSETPASE